MCIFVCFFFFKQKTAYEMRISDWSSDVCSSDLGAPEKRAGVMIDASSGPATSIEPEGVAGAGVRRLGRSLVAIVAAVAMVVGPIPVVQAQTSQPSGEISAAGKDGEAFAKSGKEGAASIPDQEVTGDVIPGYSTAPKIGRAHV